VAVRENEERATAREYLLTYGWAIAIILLVAGVLFYFGVWQPNTQPVNCMVAEDIIRQGIPANESITVHCIKYAGEDVCNCKYLRNITGWEITVSQQDWRKIA
jgi:hypothetical protein